jgi:hypothetical protein
MFSKTNSDGGGGIENLVAPPFPVDISSKLYSQSYRISDMHIFFLAESSARVQNIQLNSARHQPNHRPRFNFFFLRNRKFLA